MALQTLISVTSCAILQRTCHTLVGGVVSLSTVYAHRAVRIAAQVGEANPRVEVVALLAAEAVSEIAGGAGIQAFPDYLELVAHLRELETVLGHDTVVIDVGNASLVPKGVGINEPLTHFEPVLPALGNVFGVASPVASRLALNALVVAIECIAQQALHALSVVQVLVHQTQWLVDANAFAVR